MGRTCSSQCKERRVLRPHLSISRCGTASSPIDTHSLSAKTSLVAPRPANTPPLAHRRHSDLTLSYVQTRQASLKLQEPTSHWKTISAVPDVLTHDHSISPHGHVAITKTGYLRGSASANLSLDDNDDNDDIIWCIYGVINRKSKCMSIGCNDCGVWRRNVCTGMSSDEDEMPDSDFRKWLGQRTTINVGEQIRGTRVQIQANHSGGETPGVTDKSQGVENDDEKP